MFSCLECLHYGRSMGVMASCDHQRLCILSEESLKGACAVGETVSLSYAARRPSCGSSDAAERNGVLQQRKKSRSGVISSSVQRDADFVVMDRSWVQDDWGIVVTSRTVCVRKNNSKIRLPFFSFE